MNQPRSSSCRCSGIPVTRLTCLRLSRRCGALRPRVQALHPGARRRRQVSAADPPPTLTPWADSPPPPDPLRDTTRLDLHLVREVDVEEQLATRARLDPTVAEQVDELPRMLLARHDQHLAHARALEQLQRVVHHRPLTDRQQMLVRDARQLLETRGV